MNYQGLRPFKGRNEAFGQGFSLDSSFLMVGWMQLKDDELIHAIWGTIISN
jgi:hypothetical protein